VAYFFSYAVLGEKDLALDWLEKAINEKESIAPVGLKTAPALDFLRDEPRFKAALGRMNIPE